jgi:hypothetical protein
MFLIIYLPIFASYDIAKRNLVSCALTVYLFTKSILEKAELVHSDKIVNQIDIKLIDLEQAKQKKRGRTKVQPKVQPKVLAHEVCTKKKQKKVLINITALASHILWIGIKLLIFIFYCVLALFLVIFVGDFLNLHSEELIDNNIVKSTIDTINKPLNTLNLKDNNIISDNFSSFGSPSIKYNFHINNYEHNLNTKRILYLNSVFENIIQEMCRFNHYSYSSSGVKFDSITNMCRFTEKYLYDNFLRNGIINKLTMQEYFELINNIKNIKFNNPKLYYILCDNIKDNILLDSNSAFQYIKNKSYILDQNWLREPYKLNLSNN